MPMMGKERKKDFIQSAFSLLGLIRNMPLKKSVKAERHTLLVQVSMAERVS